MTMTMMTVMKMTLTPGNLVIRVLVGAARRLHQSFNRNVLILKLIVFFGVPSFLKSDVLFQKVPSGLLDDGVNDGDVKSFLYDNDM